MKKENKLEFFIPKKENGLGQWLAEEGISAGFPSTAYLLIVILEFDP